MPQKYTPEEVWKLIDKLPKELENVFFSVETAKNIGEICKRNGIQNNTSKIAEQVGYVLVGLLPPTDFKEYLNEEFDKETARRVLHEVNRFIFFPVKHELAELYKGPTEGTGASESIKTAPSPKTPASKKSDSDQYREPL